MRDRWIADQRQVEQRLGDEVAVADRVERVVEHVARSRARPRCTPGSSGSDEPASAPAPSGETSSRSTVAEQPVDVAAERPAVGEQVVGQQHRLGPLQVGVAGQVDVAGGLGPVEQHVLQVDDALGDVDAARACTTAAGRWRPGRCGCAPVCSLAPGGAGELGDPPLDGGVDVLVARRRTRTCPRPSRSTTWSSAASIASRSSSVSSPTRASPRDVGARAGDVVAPQPPVERQAHGVRHQLVGGPAREPPVPERRAAARRRRRRSSTEPGQRRAAGRRARRRRSTRRRRTAACRRRRPCRAARRARCGRAPTRRRARSRAACAARRGCPTTRDLGRPTRPAPGAAGRTGAMRSGSNSGMA